MDKIPKDVLVLIALELDLPTILSYCRSNSNFNRSVCDNFNFWYNKHYKEFGVNYTGEKTLPAIKKYFETITNKKITALNRAITFTPSVKNFLLSANYGPKTKEIIEIIEPLLKLNILSRAILFNLISKWAEHNNRTYSGALKLFFRQFMKVNTLKQKFYQDDLNETLQKLKNIDMN